MKKLNLAVLGAGVFGNYHAGKIAAHSEANLIGIIDNCNERASALAKAHKTQIFTSLSDVLPLIDGVIIAIPATQHGEMGLQALKAGKHVLIEKPIASTLSEAEALVSLAREKGLVLQIGHQERFVLRAAGISDIKETPIRIESQRMGPFSPRGGDVSVTLDLMIHDIDMVLSLFGTLMSCRGKSMPVISEKADVALGFLKFKNGGTARVEASRVEPSYARTMRLVYPSGEINIDFNAKSLTHSTPFKLNTNFGEDPDVKDSLNAADTAFIRSCLYGAPVAIRGESGLAALRVALQIDGDL